MNALENEQMLLNYIRMRISTISRENVRKEMLEELARAKSQLLAEGFTQETVAAESRTYENILIRVLDSEFNNNQIVIANSTEPVLFFKPEQPYGFMSNWWPSPFTIDNVLFPTTEHHMMVMKALLMGDQAMARTILNTKSPSAVKGLGKKVKNFSPQLWDTHKFEIVLTGNMAKFTQHPDLKQQLLATGDRIIAEASPYDKIWGIGMAPTDSRARNPANWKGQNLLGRILMEVRSRLRQ